MTEPPPTAKRAKPTPPLQDLKYGRAIVLLRQLQRNWNLLDREGEFLDHLCADQHGEERLEYIHDMEEMMAGDPPSLYGNPFGADDRETFADFFGQLTRAEQRAFRNQVESCVRENRPLTDNDLNEVLLQSSSKPREPFFISLDPDTSPSAANGTERLPFASVEQAESVLRRDCRVKLLKCGGAPSSCKTKKCYRCPTMVCTTHGDSGNGTYYEHGYTLWEFSKCMHCQETIGCARHRFPECNVCRNGVDAEMAVGAHEFPCQFDLCDECAQVCHDTVETNDDDEEGPPCGFRCCPNHIDDHRCGYNPADYV